MKLPKFKVPQQFIVGAVAGILSSVLVWVISFIEPLAKMVITAIQYGGRSWTLSGAVTGTEIGTQLVQQLSSKVGWTLSMPAVLTAAIGGGVLVMIGKWIYDMDWSPDAIPMFKPTPMTKLALVLFYGSVLATVALMFIAGAITLSISAALTTFVVLAVNSLITAWFMSAVVPTHVGLL